MLKRLALAALLFSLAPAARADEPLVRPAQQMPSNPNDVLIKPAVPGAQSALEPVPQKDSTAPNRPKPPRAPLEPVPSKPASPATEAGKTVRRAAVQTSATEGVEPAEAIDVEAKVWAAFAPLLAKRGFALEPLDSLHAVLREQGIPEMEQHAPSNSPSNTALIVEMRKRDVELVWMTVLSRDRNKVRLAFAPMAFHDLTNLGVELRQADSIAALEALIAKDAPALVDNALAKFKPTPMPGWWRPVQFAQQLQANAQPLAPAQVAAQKSRLPDGAQVAVLDFKRGAKFSVDDARYLADVMRGATLRLAPRLSVMTRENLIVLLQASGKDINECEGECEVDTGRRIGADAVISGDVLKFGAHYKLSLRLHETKNGRLIAASVASGATLEELDADLQTRAAELLESQR